MFTFCLVTLSLLFFPTVSIVGTMDGRSIVSELVTDPNHPGVAASVRRHLSGSVALGGNPPRGGRSKRDGVAYIEYHGLRDFVGSLNRKMDSLNNTYRALRIIAGNASRGIELGRRDEPQHAPHGGGGSYGNGHGAAASASVQVTGNLLYAEWAGNYGFDTVVFREVFDLEVDPWQMHNIVNSTSAEVLQQLAQTTQDFWRCEGAGCR